jgi:simple sugar transport system permease protein
MTTRLFRRSEFFIGITTVLTCLIIGLVNKEFFSVVNLFDLIKSSIEMGIMAMGVLLVIISGGIDVSFPAIAIFAYYATVKLLNALGFDGGVIWIFLVAGGVGLLLGLINSLFISYFKIPTLIASLGTSTLFRGVLLVFLGTTIINNLPDSLTRFGMSNLFRVAGANGASVGLSTSVVVLALMALATWLLLKYTMTGRGIYALGGDPISARRIGFSPVKLQIIIYALVGFFSGIAGVVHGSVVRNANPFDLYGMELNVIAAVVLGGARITGGHGTVTGTVFGVFLVVVINNSLILMGVPSYWQKVVIGLLILIGTGISANQSRLNTKAMLLEEK